MPLSVVMPALEMAQETGKVVAWHKREGETVAKGDILLEIETDKAVVEIEALGAGILGGVSAREGDVVPVGQTIAWLLADGELAPTETTATLTGRRIDAPAVASASVPIPLLPTSSATRGKLSPKARRLAAEYGVDPTVVRGTGVGGEILAEDIMAAAKSASSNPPRAVGSLGTIGRLMAERTTQSWTTVPHFFVVRDVDASGLLALRERLAAPIEQANGVKVTHTDLLLSLTARVLRNHIRMNASWTGDAIRINEEINLAIAMAVPDGVVAPVIRQIDTMSLRDIALRRRDLAERARTNHLQPADLSGGTFTVSNLGMYGVDAFTAIIVPPQAAILAVGAIADRVVAINGQMAVRPIVTLTVSSDHRVIDGARAAAFMKELAEAIRDPDVRLNRTE